MYPRLTWSPFSASRPPLRDEGAVRRELLDPPGQFLGDVDMAGAVHCNTKGIVDQDHHLTNEPVAGRGDW